MGLTKNQLEQLNNNSFPNNNSGYITPDLLRTFNSSSIAATVNQDDYTADSASFDSRIDSLENFSSSLVTNFATVAYVNSVSSSLVSTASFNQYTSSTNALINGLVTTSSFNTLTASVNNISSSVGLLQTFSGSQYKADSASFSSRIVAAENTGYVTTASFNSYTSSTDTKINSLNTISASYLSFTQSYYSDSSSFSSRINSITTSSLATTGSNTFNGNQIINGNVSASSYVSASKFVGDGSQLTGVTASVSIAILDEGVYQGNATSLNFTGSGLTASVVAGVALIQAQIDQTILNGYLLTSSFNSYTQSNDTKVNNLNVISQSYLAFTQSYYQDSASFSGRIGAFVSTASFNAYTQSTDLRLNSLESATSSYAISSSVAAVDIAQDGKIASLTALTASTAYTNVNNSFNGTQSFDNVIVNGTASVAFLNVIYQSSSVIYSSGSNILGDNANDDTQTLIGRNIATGSFEVTGSSRFNGNISITGSANINGSPIIVSSQTSSMAVSSSTYAVSSSQTINADTASVARNLVVIARNGNQSTLGAGTVVRITSAVGDNPIFNTASFDIEALSSNTLGILRNSIASGADGEVVVNGIVLGVNTDPANGYVAGDVIYLSSSGQFTKVQPQAPNQTVTLGEVLRAQQNNGSIYVNVSNGWELNELHNVLITSPQQNDILSYVSGAYGLWENKSISSLGLTTTSSFNSYTSSNDSKWAALGSQSGSWVTAAITASSLVTASFDTGTRNLTFTKGNNSTFSVNIPDVSGSTINTGSFLTTGSVGVSQSVYGGITIDGSYTSSIVLGNSGSSGNILYVDYGAFSDPNFIYWVNSGFANVKVNGSGVTNATITNVNYSSTLELTLSSGTATAGGNYTLSGPWFNNLVVTGSILTNRGIEVNPKESPNLHYTLDTNGFNAVDDNTSVSTVEQPGRVEVIELNGNILGLMSTASITPAPLDITPAGPFMYTAYSSNYRPMFGFQSEATWTDGTITAFRNVSFSSSINVTGSAIFSELTGSLGAFSASVSNRANLNASTASANSSSIGLLQTFSGSQYKADSSSFDSRITTNLNNIATLTSKTGSYATTGSNSFTGSQSISGSLSLTGSVAGNIIAVSVASSTASIDFSLGSFFTLTIPSSSITYITGSNLKAGQTANIILTQQATTGSVRFETTLFKFPSGSINTGSAVASAVDMVSVASVNGTTLYSVNARQLQ